MVDSLAWAAGLFEGEGCFFVGGTGQRQPVVCLTMTDEDIVLRFAAVMRCGGITGRPGRVAGNKPCWRWSVQGKDDVLSVVAMLWPFLGDSRQEKAMEVVERAVKMNDGIGFCKHGHDLSLAANSYLHEKTGKRHCVPCRNRRSREYEERRRSLRRGA